MTPCEEKGYKVGDWFEVLPEAEELDASIWGKGTHVKLKDDDGTYCPEFVDDQGEEDWLNVNLVKPLKVEESVLPLIEDSEGNLYVEAGSYTIPNSLADQLEEALANLEAAEKEVERLQTAYREAYPRIHGKKVEEGSAEGVVPGICSNEFSSWKKGDKVVCVSDDDDDITKGKEYELVRDIDLDGMIHFKGDDGDHRCRSGYDYRLAK